MQKKVDAEKKRMEDIRASEEKTKKERRAEYEKVMQKKE